MHWHKSRTNKRAIHYKETDSGLLVVHGNKHVIFDCTANCACTRVGKCTNNGLMRLKQNPLPFVIFKSASDKGWGLKCMRNITKGELVIEYIGERISLGEFHRREKEQEESGTMYCIELTDEDKKDHEEDNVDINDADNRYQQHFVGQFVLFNPERSN